MSHGIYGNTERLRQPKFLSLCGEVSSLEEVGAEFGKERERVKSFLFCATGQSWLHSRLAATASRSLHTKQSSVVRAYTERRFHIQTILGTTFVQTNTTTNHVRLSTNYTQDGQISTAARSLPGHHMPQHTRTPPLGLCTYNPPTLSSHLSLSLCCCHDPCGLSIC